MFHKIQNEDDLFNLIQKIQADGWTSSEKLYFDGWPKYEVIICGKDFNSSIPTRLAPAITTLQHEINRGYARYIYGKIRPLSKEEKKSAELIVHLRPGSMQLDPELWNSLNNLVSSLPTEKMTGNQVFALLVTLAITASLAWSKYLSSCDRRYKREQDTERLRILAELAPDHPLVTDQNMDAEATITQFLKALDSDDKLTVNGKFIITGQKAQQILRMRSHLPTDKRRIDGVFVIDQVKYGNKPNFFQIWVKNISSNSKLKILNSIPRITVIGNQIDALRNANALREAWEKKTQFQMQIMISVSGTKIIRGTLMTATRVSIENNE